MKNIDSFAKVYNYFEKSLFFEIQQIVYNAKALLNRSKTLIAIILLLNISNYLFSQVKPNGYNVFFYTNGKKSSEGNMKDGKPVGYWKTYYPNGAMKSEGSRKNMQLDSTWIFYDNKQNITKKISYLNGNKNGYYFIYKLVGDSLKTNIIISKELYLNNIKQGKSYEYHDNEQLKKIVNYKKGRKNGKAKEYSNQAVVITLFRYKYDIIIERERINRYDRNNLKQGVWKEFYANDRLKMESFYKNGKLHGYLKIYNAKGKITSRRRYIDGELVIIKIDNKEKVEIKNEFYSDGSLKSSGGYKDNKPVGVHRKYSKDGKIISSQTYSKKEHWISSNGIVDKDGKRQGAWKYFYKNGKIKSIGAYKNGRRVGEWVFYYENGNIEQKGKYIRGKPNDKWVWYYQNGSLLRNEDFIKGKSEGLYVEYAEDSTIIVKGNFIDGKKEGKWIYNVGDQKEERYYKDGLKDGLWKYFYSNKKLKFEGYFMQDEAQGIHKHFYENGKLKQEGKYMMGKPHGAWKSYSPEGMIEVSISYLLGKEIKIDGKKIKDN